MNDLEYQHQVAVFMWAEREQVNYPELRLLNASANGMKRTPGVGAKLKKSGVKAGYPDIFLPVARHGFHGLYVELKIGDNKLRPNQREWRDWLREQDYMCMMCVGKDAVKRTIIDYLGEGNA